jgi:GntR family transcriptional regulator
MTIDRDAGTPPWRQLAALLRDRIRRGEFTGARLPSQRYLSQEYEVAITTVRKALQLLQDEGLIVTARGWGSSVAQGKDGGPPPPQGEPPGLTGRAPAEERDRPVVPSGLVHYRATRRGDRHLPGSDRPRPGTARRARPGRPVSRPRLVRRLGLAGGGRTVTERETRDMDHTSSFTPGIERDRIVSRLKRDDPENGSSSAWSGDAVQIASAGLPPSAVRVAAGSPSISTCAK